MDKCLLLKLKKPPDTLTFPLLLSENMLEKTVSTQNNYHLEDIDIGLTLTNQSQKSILIPNIQLPMLESHLINRVETSPDKYNISENNDQMPLFSPILDLVSTTTEKTLKPFFNLSSKVISERLWLPIKTDSQESDFPFLNGYLASSEQNLHLWKLINSQEQLEMKCWMKSWKLSQSLQPDIMVLEDMKLIENEEEKEKIPSGYLLRSKKIPFKPSKYLREFINKNFNVYEDFYNQAIDEINNRYQYKKNEFTIKNCCIHQKCKNEKAENSWFCINHKNEKINWDLKINKPSLCSVINVKNNEVDTKYLDVLYDIRVNGVIAAINSYKTAIKSKQKGYIDNFELKKKNSKNQRICKFTKKSLSFSKKNEKFYLNKKICNGQSEILFKKRHHNWIRRTYPNGIDFEFSIFKDITGQHYIIIPYLVEKTKNEKDNIIALDPGVRTFQTGYDPEGSVFEAGSSTIKKLKKLFDRISISDCILSNKSYETLDDTEKTKIQLMVKDKSNPKTNQKYKSKSRRRKEKEGIWEEKDFISKSKSLIRSRLIRKRRRYHKKCSDEVCNLHNKLGCFLTKTYKTILLPDFPVSKLIKKIRKESNDSKRVFNTRVARMMQSLSFYKFDQKLKSLCKRRGNNLYIVDESYTSKTCGRCGNLHNSLGGSKIYKCNSCGLKIDRDINGARNILLKHLVLD